MITAFIIFTLFLIPSASRAANAGEVVINEVAYNLEGADDSHEWVEILNISIAPVDLTGWRFNDGSNHILNIPPEKGSMGSIVIQPGEYAIFADDAATFLGDHPGFSRTVIDTVMSLNNTSDNLSLLDNEGNIIYSMSYQNSLGADGNGKTLEKNENSWDESVNVGGTPGAPNSAKASLDEQNSYAESSPLPPPPDDTPSENIEEDGPTPAEDESTPDLSDSKDPSDIGTEQPASDGNDGSESNQVSDIFNKNIFINEIMPNPAGSDSEEEWIEIHNASQEHADLSDWQISDLSGATNTYVFSEGMTIPPGAFLVLYRPSTKITLNNDGDGLELIWPDGAVADSVLYEKAPKGQSYSRQGSEWAWSSSPTPWLENIISAPDNKSETNPNPPNNKTAKDTAGISINPPESASISDNNATTNINEYQPISANISGANVQKSGDNLLKYVIAPLIAALSALFIFILKKRPRPF